MRRAYLEIACLHIIADDKYKIENVLADLLNDQPNAFKEQEYDFIEQLMEALIPPNGVTVLD